MLFYFNLPRMEHSTNSDIPAKSNPCPLNLCRGAIVWLPVKRWGNPSTSSQLLRLPARIFDHPVVIYNLPQPGKADVFVVTSFKNGESLSADSKFNNDANFRSRQLPISPAPKHPDTGVLLTMAGGRLWPKQSYVSLLQFTVPCWALREEAKGPWTLSPESLQALDDAIAALPEFQIWGKLAEEKSVIETSDSPNDDVEGEGDDWAAEIEEEGWTQVVQKRKRKESVSISK